MIRGIASDALLDSASDERVFATHENLRHGTKSTEFTAPSSFAFELMRKAVLTQRLQDTHVNRNRSSGTRMTTDTERDLLYTAPCRTITGIGEADASLFLARFVLLSIEAIGQSATVARLIGEAGEGLPDTNVPAATRERQDD